MGIERRNGQNPRLVLPPIHPFTERQAQLLELRANGYSYEEIAEKCNISCETVRVHFCGTQGDSAKSYLGILGIIEKASGLRPAHWNVIAPLIGDVLFYEDELDKHRQMIEEISQN